jgi:hypothetical protein
MAAAATSYEHIAVDERGVPVIIGANAKVVEVVGLARSHGLHPEEIRDQLPHLSRLRSGNLVGLTNSEKPPRETPSLKLLASVAMRTSLRRNAHARVADRRSKLWMSVRFHLRSLLARPTLIATENTLWSPPTATC